MKKKFLALSLLLTCGLIVPGLSSCGGDNPPEVPVDPDDPNTPENPGENPGENPTEDKVTGVVVTGPLSVDVGGTIQLLAEVQGSDDDSVTWSVDKQDIASIDDKGVLTGLKEGTVKVTATSKKDPKFSGTYDVMVRGIEASGISIKILTQDEDIYEKDGAYFIPGGKEFKISYELNDGATRVPDSVSYTFSYASGETVTSLDCEINYQDDGSALVKFNKVFEGGVITASASYKTSTSADMKSSIRVNSYDVNAENAAKLDGIVASIHAKELSDLTKGTHVVKTLGQEITSVFDVYDGATYSEVTTVTSGKDGIKTSETTHAYSTIDKNESAMYYFTYNETSEAIEEIYVNEIYNQSSESTYENYAKLPHFMIEGVPQYGFSTLLSSIVSGATYQVEAALGDFSARGNATYSFTDTSATVVSEYVNDVDSDVKIEFALNFTTSFELTSYSYKVSIREASAETMSVVYEESGSDFSYGNKTVDTEKKIDINQYYIKDFKISYVENYSEIAGDGSDNTRYEYDEYLPESNAGRDVYNVTYNHSLPLKIDEVSPVTGSTMIDNATVTVTNHITGSRNFGIYSDGIAVINAPRDTEGNILEAQDTVRFETRGGGIKEVIINWSAPSLGGLEFEYFDGSLNVEGTHTFPSVREYQRTGYFWLNTDTDDTSYEYALSVTKGDESGIKMVAPLNDKEVPNGAYYLDALKAGEYEFHFYVVGHEDIHTPTFKLTVKEAISAETYKENLVGKTFERSTGTQEFALKFTTDTYMELTMPTSSDRVEGGEYVEEGTTTVRINYTISDGRVTITPNTDKASVQIFDSENSYYDSAYAEDIDVSEDFSNVTIQLRIRSDAVNDPYYYSYNLYTFALPTDLSDLSGKSFSADAQVFGMNNSKLTLNFVDGASGTMTMTQNSTGTKFAEFTFKYTFDSATGLSLSEVTTVSSSIDGLVYKSSSMYDENTIDITFEVPTGFGYSLSSIFRIDLRNAI